jgi:hypothetical protein
MNPELQEAFGFKDGDVVQMLVETSGLDADDNEITFPVGALAIIDRIERLGIAKEWPSPSQSRERSSTYSTRTTDCRARLSLSRS